MWPLGARQRRAGYTGKNRVATNDKSLNLSTVREAYKRQAPFYDYTFGVVSQVARRRTVELLNQRRGRILEVGVGTGLALKHYAPFLKVTGVDLSPEMLAKARQRVEQEQLRQVEALHEMDAANMDLPSDSFDTVVAMFVMSVVPDPEKVMAELERVCAPGGEVMTLNHFSQDHGVRGWVERKMAPYCETFGWHPVFPFDRVMGRSNLQLVERKPMWPMGLFTLVRFRKMAPTAG
jgi:phosphatidylethanolamine/phosphatidyl-N-methylethanolamine N-methyltransferase